MKIERHKAYKDSEIEHLGEVPKHWRTQRIKDLSVLQSGNNITSEQIEAEGKYPVYGGNGLRGYFSKYTNNGSYILIGRQGALCGNINHAFGRFWATEHAIVVYLKHSICMKWYGEMLRTMNLNQYSVSAAQPGLSVDRIKRLLLPVPPLPEQKTIAHYLDTKTAQIDRKIDLLTQKATLYSNLKQSLINETVTRGLDKTVPMKDSGIEWIGEVPKHWIFCRHKDNFSFITTRCLDPTLLKLGLENIEGKTGQHISTENDFDGDGIEFKKNDILFGKLRPYLAKVYLAEFGGSAVGDIFVYRPKSNTIPKFARYLMLSNRYIDVINSSTVGAKMPRVGVSFIANLPVITPPIAEQKAIADYLDTKTAQIDQIIQTINTQIEKLKELRKTLINDVVTGKIKVVENEH